MEEKIFPKSAVAETLGKYFIEARLHYDKGPHIAENKKLQQELAQSSANPFYVIIDTLKGKEVKSPMVLRRKGGLMSTEKFLEFLRGHPGDGVPKEFER
jgi:hypothetical protein